MAFYYSPKLVTDGLVFAVDAANTKSYPGSGTTWKDLSGNGNDGTLTNGPTFDSANGGSIVFDGTNDYVSLGEGGLSFPNNNADFTLEIVVKLNDNTYQQTLFQQEDSGGTGRSWIFFRNVGGNTNFSSYLGGSDLLLTSLSAVSTGVIYYLHLKYQSGVLYIGYNGTWYQSSTKNIDENSTGGFRIGSGKNTNAVVDGNIYLTKIYNRALTSAEISQNYNALKSRFGL